VLHDRRERGTRRAGVPRAVLDEAGQPQITDLVGCLRPAAGNVAARDIRAAAGYAGVADRLFGWLALRGRWLRHGLPRLSATLIKNEYSNSIANRIRQQPKFTYLADTVSFLGLSV